jgi:murein L,D-transpeptidase YafK
MPAIDLLLIIIIGMLPQQKTFKEIQSSKSRVKAAYAEKESEIKNAFREKNLRFDGMHLFIRGFKREEKLEVWVREKDKQNFSIFCTYDFCASSGTLGPKRKEGDLQIPEGVYHINHFNPESNFHLSLGINYPNDSDKILGDKTSPGSAIYIHGNCVTIGCIPITDDKIKELYILAVEARNNGQEKIPVHIFPTKLDDQTLSGLTSEFTPAQMNFWRNLKPIYESFENDKKLRKVTVSTEGKYILH